LAAGASRFETTVPHRSEKEHADYTAPPLRCAHPAYQRLHQLAADDMPSQTTFPIMAASSPMMASRKELRESLRRFVSQAERQAAKRRVRATTTLTHSLLGLYTCRASQDREWEWCTKLSKPGPETPPTFDLI